jgi:hypothetical protein
LAAETVVQLVSWQAESAEAATAKHNALKPPLFALRATPLPADDALARLLSGGGDRLDELRDPLVAAP